MVNCAEVCLCTSLFMWEVVLCVFESLHVCVQVCIHVFYICFHVYMDVCVHVTTTTLTIHDNVHTFVCVCVHAQHTYLLCEHCSIVSCAYQQKNSVADF